MGSNKTLNRDSAEIEQNSGQEILKLGAQEVLCLAKEKNYDLYLIISGKLLVCVTKGTEVTPLAYLEKGDYLGELSFFDEHSRSAHVMTLEECVLIRIQNLEKERHFPSWLLSVASCLTRRIRELDEVIRVKGIRRSKVNSIRPLSLTEQKLYFEAIEAAQKRI